MLPKSPGARIWALGYPDQALKSAQRALTLAYELSHPLSLALALVFNAIVHQLRRETKLVQERSEAALAISGDHGFPYFTAWASILKGWTLAQQGEREGIEQVREGIAAYRATGAESFRAYHFSLLAESYEGEQETTEALEVAEEGMTWTNKDQEGFHRPELNRLKGELLYCNGLDGGEPERHFRDAIEIAQKQAAKSLELRATMSLARLRAEQAHYDEARTMLAHIYNWFTEGIDTADLTDAKALLDQLETHRG